MREAKDPYSQKLQRTNARTQISKTLFRRIADQITQVNPTPLNRDIQLITAFHFAQRAFVPLPWCNLSPFSNEDTALYKVIARIYVINHSGESMTTSIRKLVWWVGTLHVCQHKIWEGNGEMELHMQSLAFWMPHNLIRQSRISRYGSTKENKSIDDQGNTLEPLLV